MAETGRQGIEEAEPPLSCQVNDERRIGGTTFCRYTKLMQKPQELPDQGIYFSPHRTCGCGRGIRTQKRELASPHRIRVRALHR